ncbi:hypothetical protein E1B28_000253 [Marasmius oreades]|uniref:F-box domain-containing protein n=1 Tax=Marasmius oreades TaxID=181124 RepID=A0A9P7V0W4_9AGAR|nr:uncharacterized protein E1B28_000253 [Marasmius oreades]KAG7098290.1 hypothetical protein E1B28_000253 [Marasmius oreades]
MNVSSNPLEESQSFRSSHPVEPWHSSIQLLQNYVANRPGNFIAPPDDIFELDRALHDAHLTLAGYGYEIQTLQWLLKRVAEKHSLLLSTIRQVEPMTKVTIRMLPTEILGQIFELCVNRAQDALVLSHVCSQWRTITFSLSTLWMKIAVVIADFSTAGHLNMTRLALKNSGNRPLDINVITSADLRLYPDPKFCAFTELLKHTDRWQYARLFLPTHRHTTLPPAFPILEKLAIIHGCTMGLLDMQEPCRPVLAPRLRDLQVCDRQWGRHLVTENLNTLTMSQFVCFPVLLQMLQNPTLKNVRLLGWLDLLGYTYDVTTKVVSNITSLEIDHLHPLAPFFDQVTLPSLKNLDIHNCQFMDAGSAAYQFNRCIVRSRPPLETLAICNFPMLDWQVLQALSVLPSLTRFSFTCHDARTNFHTLTEAFFRESPNLLRSLEYLKLNYGRYTPWNGTLLTSMVVALWHQTPRKLKSFSVGCYPGDFDSMTMKNLSRLEGNGLELSIELLDPEDAIYY